MLTKVLDPLRVFGRKVADGSRVSAA